MTPRERITAVFNHKQADRVGIMDHFWWEPLVEWQSEGSMPKNADPEDYFDFDIRKVGMDISPMLPRENVEDTEDYRIFRDEFGMLNREWKKKQSTPELLDFACKSREKWYGETKQRMAWKHSRLDVDGIRTAVERWRREGRYVTFSVLEVFETGWRIIGPELQLEVMLDDPEWLHDIYETITSLIERGFETILQAGIELDGVWLWGDISYRGGCFFSPAMYRELVMPYHKRLCGLAHRVCGKTIYHGCGDNTRIIPLLIESGVDCLQPLEVKAGMDVLQAKRDYGEWLSFMGNIDARLLQSNDLPGLEKELKEKIEFAKRGGGYVYHTDHSVPPGTSYDIYTKVLEMARTYGRYNNNSNHH